MKKFIINKYLNFVFKISKNKFRERPERKVGKVVVYYRICDAGYLKVKPNYITKENCFRNAVKCFPLDQVEWHVIGDNICDETYNMLIKYIPESLVQRVSVGHGSGTFRKAYEDAIISYNDDTLVYFLEDDYLHLPNSLACLRSISENNYADYITLYDSPDKYGFVNKNPFVKNGGESTMVFLTNMHHWKLTNSTTMTMAAFVDVLKRDKSIWWRWTETNHPYDFQIFINLNLFSHAKLLSPIPSLSTHGETALLAPLVDWESTL